MTKTKISPLEELRLRKTQLLEESNIHKDNLFYNWEYTKTHFGKLLLNSTVSSTKSGFSDVLSLITGKSDKIEKPSAAMNVFTSAAPLIWNFAQPILLGLLIKKVKSAFTGGKKKKKR